MALAIDASTPAVATQPNANSATLTTASFTPPANSLLLIMWSGNSTGGVNPSAPSITDSLGSHLTYTLLDWQSRANSPTVDGQAASWWAKVGTSAAMTVTVTTGVASNNKEAALQVIVLTGQDPTTPIGAHGKSGSASAASIAQSYTATVTSGWGFVGVLDWSALGAETAGTGCTLISSGNVGVGQISYGYIRRTTADDSNGVSNTLNVTLPGTSTALSWVYAEVVPPTAAAAAPPLAAVRRGRTAVPARARGRASTPAPAQASPPFQPAHRTRLALGRLRGRVALFAPPQVVVPPPPYVSPPVHRLRQVLGRLRGHSVAPVPPQVVVPPPPYVSPTVHRLRQVLGRVRGRDATPVPPQVVVTPPPYVPAERTPRRFAALLRRTHASTPPQVAPPPQLPAHPRRIPLLPRRTAAPSPTAATTQSPPPPQASSHPRRALFTARRRQATPPPPQVVVVPPPYPPMPVYKRLLAFVTRRGRAQSVPQTSAAVQPPRTPTLTVDLARAAVTAETGRLLAVSDTSRVAVAADLSRVTVAEDLTRPVVVVAL